MIKSRSSAVAVARDDGDADIGLTDERRFVVVVVVVVVGSSWDVATRNFHSSSYARARTNDATVTIASLTEIAHRCRSSMSPNEVAQRSRPTKSPIEVARRNPHARTVRSRSRARASSFARRASSRVFPSARKHPRANANAIALDAFLNRSIESSGERGARESTRTETKGIGARASSAARARARARLSRARAFDRPTPEKANAHGRDVAVIIVSLDEMRVRRKAKCP